jgi:hypothetical protein
MKITRTHSKIIPLLLSFIMGQIQMVHNYSYRWSTEVIFSTIGVHAYRTVSFCGRVWNASSACNLSPTYYHLCLVHVKKHASGWQRGRAV